MKRGRKKKSPMYKWIKKRPGAMVEKSLAKLFGRNEQCLSQQFYLSRTASSTATGR